MPIIIKSLGVAALAVGALAPAIPSVSAAAPASPPDPGRIGIRLVDAPVVRRDDPRALKYVVDFLKPGTVIKRHVKISNKTSVTRKFLLYPSAAFIRHETFTFPSGRRQNELSSWVHIHPATKTIKPHKTATAEMVIRVPNDARSGERYAVVWAQTSVAPDATHNVSTASRVGVRLYLAVGKGGEPPSQFKIHELVGLRDKHGCPRVIARVRNTGGRAVDLTGALFLTDGPGGAMAGPFPADVGTTLAPGHAGTIVVPLPRGLSDGPWKARLRLESGKVKRELTGRLTFPPPGGKSIATLLRTQGTGVWMGVGGGALALGAASSLMVARHRRRPSP